MTESKSRKQGVIEIGGVKVLPGTRVELELPAARLPTATELTIPVTIINAPKKGPALWLSAAVHGDEINGVEIIRRVLDQVQHLSRGVVYAAPIVNVFGFINQSRYLPDRRDLNRSFPGSEKGSLASRIAHLFLDEIVARCTHGMDLHTASVGKTNYPQVRGNLEDPETLRLAEAFAAPVMVNSKNRSGSLRGAAMSRGIASLVFEGGEPLRFNEPVIEVGVRGVIAVMRELGMLPRRRRKRLSRATRVEDSKWVRARRGGILRLSVAEGARVAEREVIGSITDPFGKDPMTLRAPFQGVVLGKTMMPLVYGGDAIVHIGKVGTSAD